MIGSYAYSKRKHISNDFKLGQGLVGQAALEKKSILVTEVPDDYTAIRSGLGEAHPRNILVQPFLYENKLTGVIELGSFDKLSDLIDTLSASRRPRPPLVAIDRAKLAVGVGPFVPDGDAMLIQQPHIGRALQEPQQLMDDRLHMQLLRGGEGKALRQIEAHLRAEQA